MVAQTAEKGARQTELGIIPEDWELKSIGSEIDLLTGFPFLSSKYVSSGIRLLRGSNIKRGKTDWSEEITEYWNKVTFELRPYVLNEGDIVIAMDGSLVGRSFARLSHKDVPALLLQRVARIRSGKIDMGYLKECICSDYFTEYCDSVKTVTAIPHISPQDIRKFIIPIPPTREEQSAIAQVLSEADDLIESLDKLIEKKKNIKQGAMQELLTGKRRLPGFGVESGEEKVTKLTEAGIIPQDWEVKRLGEVVDFLDSRRIPIKDSDRLKMKGPYPYYGASGIIDYVNDYIFNEDLILLGEDGENIVSRNCRLVFKTSGKIWVNNHAHVLRSKSAYDIKFLTELLESLNYEKYNTGTAQPKLNQQICSQIPIQLPPTKKEQSSIAQVLSDMDSEIEELEQKRDKHRQLKTGMMQQLLTGRIRLKWKS